jgi:hypothetical protein
LWRVVFQGLLEKPSFEAPHLDAGAGDWGLVAQFFMAVLTVISALVWSFVELYWRRKVLVVGLAIATAAFLVFTARGLQRFAPGFSEAAFQRLQASHNSGSFLVSADVIAKLGEPLMRQELPIGGESWLYSYMPSCGFGWDKKYLRLDATGRVVDIFTNNEP